MAGLTKNADKQNRGRNGHNRNREQHRSTERVGAGSTLARKADQYYQQRPYSPHNFHKDPNIVYGVKTDSPPVMARLKIGQPNDKYEQEADAVADKVVNAPAVQQKELPDGGPEAKLDTPKADLGDQFAQRYYDTRPFSPHNFHQTPGAPDISSLSGPSPVAKKPAIQRDAEPDVQEKEEIGTESISAEPRLDDPDTSAESPPPGDAPSDGGDAPVLQQKCETCGADMGGAESTDSQGGDPPPIQQKCAACEADGMAQMSAMGGDEGGKPSTSASPEGLLLKGGDGQSYGSDGLQNRLNSSKGSGDPLPDQTRSGMEDNIGADFGNVRVHTGSDAVQMSQDIGAQAFTHGSDIYFNEGKYQPETSEGKHLLAHELTHTVQQGAAPAIQQKQDLSSIDIQAKGLLSGASPEVLQRAEEVDEEELKKQLEDSEDEREKAVDPLPAQREEKEALKPNPDLLEGPDTLATDEIGEAAKEAAPGAEGEGAPPPAVPAEKEKGKKGKGGKPEKDPTMGTVGKELAQTSEKVCPDAESKTGELAANEKKTDSPEDKLAQTEGAVVPPATEGQAMGNAGQVETVEGNPAPEVSEQEAKAELQSAISSSIPSDVDAMNKFKSKGKGEVVGAKVMGKVNEDVDAVKGTYNEMEQAAAPEPPSNVPTELPPTEVAAETPEMNLGEGAVPELSDEQTDMSNFENESDEQMKKEGITDEQLEMVDSGDLAEAKKERKGLKKKVKDTPGKLKEEAKAKAKKVDQDAKSEEKKAKSDMRKKRDGALAETQGKQQKTKTDLEKKREAVTNHINGIYDKAKKSVTKKLGNLESVNKAAFKVGQAAATRTFENEVNADVKRWKRKRYSGIFGGVKWLKDKLFGIADFPEIKNAFERAKKRYIERIDQLIATINAANQKVIADCKQELADAKKQIKEYVDGLGPELKAAGQAAQKEMAKKLEEMNSFVDKKQKELVDKLCKAKDQAIKDIDKKIEKMKSEMSGLIAMLGNLLLEALKKFFEWALTAVGKDPKPLLNILDKGAAVIKALFGDPIAFVKNLVGATKKGIDQFKANIKKHLISGLVGWLTGAMSEVSITLPEVWDLKGILHFILQLLGLTWENLRAKLVKRVGEKVVSMAETGVEIVKTVINEGPIGLWNWVKEKASDIKAQVFAGIRNYVITNLVKKGIIKLVSMLNPAGAIVQAIIGIFDTVMFFVENWDSILDFVNSIFDSISNIAAGKIGAAANFIEATMAKTIPIILNFLGKFIGLSGIGKAVQSTVKKIRKPVDKAMDKGLDFMENAARKLFGKKKKGDKDKDKKGDKGDGEVGKKISFSAGGESHKMWVKQEGKKATIMVASEVAPVEQKIRAWEGKLSTLTEENQGKAKPRLKIAKDRLGIVDREADEAAKENVEAAQNAGNEQAQTEANKADDELELAEQPLADILRELFDIFGDTDADAKVAIPSRAAIVEAEKRLKTATNHLQDQIYQADNTISGLKPNQTEFRGKWNAYKQQLVKEQKRRGATVTSLETEIKKLFKDQKDVEEAVSDPDKDMKDLGKDIASQIEVRTSAVNTSINTNLPNVEIDPPTEEPFVCPITIPANGNETGATNQYSVEDRAQAAGHSRVIGSTFETYYKREEQIGAQGGRSGEHGAPHKRTRTRMDQIANNLSGTGPNYLKKIFAEELKKEGMRRWQEGKGHSHLTQH